MDWRAFGLALVALTAGCGGFTGSEPTESLTPAPVPGVATETERTSAIAPGLGGGRVVDVERLARAHRQSIRNRSYVWTEQRQRLRTVQRPILIDTTLRVEHEFRYTYEQVSTLSRVNSSDFADGEKRYRRRIGWATLQYDRANATAVTDRFGQRPTQAIRQFLAIGEASVRKTRVDGNRYFVVNGSMSSLPVIGPVDNYSARALVAPSGFVRSLSATYDDGDDSVEYSYRYTKVDETTVPRPGWVRDQWGTATPTT